MRRAGAVVPALLVPAALLAALALTGADGLHGAPGSRRRVVVPRTDPSAAAASVEVAGSERRMLDSRAAGDWTLVVAVDPPLASAAGGERAAGLLAERAERLASLGEVTLVVVDGLVDAWLEGSDDPQAIAGALESIPGAGGWGELLAGRAAVSREADPSERLESAREELRLVRWQREPLVDWLLTSDLPSPKALLLVQNAFDGDLQDAWGLTDELGSGAPSPTLDDTALAPALAAAGWVVFPLDLDAAAGTRGAAGHQALARETGGRVVTGGAELDAGLDSLAAAISLTLDLDSAPTGPLPFAAGPEGALSPPRWIAGAFLPGRGAARARRFLAEGEGGGLSVEASLHYPPGDASSDGTSPDGSAAIVEVRADLEPPGSPPSSDWLSLTLYLDQVGAPPAEVEIQGGAQPLAGVDRWVTQTALRLPEEATELVAVVTDGLTGRWGAARVEEEGERLARGGPGLAVESFDLRPAQGERGEAEPGEAEGEAPGVVTLVAPSGDRLSGPQRFRTLVSTPEVVTVVFSLDGEPVATDEDPPFGARIDLGPEVGRHTVSVEAFDRLGDRIGGDSVRLNEPVKSFDVAIGEVVIEGSPARVSFAAAISSPADVPVDRVEFYFNERLLGTATSPPWTISATVGATGETDFVSAVAHFADGSSLEDVRLLSALGTNERVEVNLVQVYVVATGRDGDPVTDLAQADFEVRLRDQPQAIERFAYADEVPLSLALVIDTSGSMFALMPDTITAAARFLSRMLTEKDEALLVDFDEQARITSPLTGDVGRLLRSLGRLDVGLGDLQRPTALYDSVVFSALELPEGQGRKAIVLLSDGDDTSSRLSLGRAIDTAKQVGAPVYVVSMVGVHDPRRGGKRPAITALTAQTGGEGFYLSEMRELDGAYARIAAELRSQYLLAFPTDVQLTQADIDSIRVRVARPGLELRTVVGGRSVE